MRFCEKHAQETRTRALSLVDLNLRPYRKGFFEECCVFELVDAAFGNQQISSHAYHQFRPSLLCPTTPRHGHHIIYRRCLGDGLRERRKLKIGNPGCLHAYIHARLTFSHPRPCKGCTRLRITTKGPFDSNGCFRYVTVRQP